MKPKLITRFALSVTFLGVCAPMFAHHGNSQYDEKHPVTITGTVTEFVWQNPHCQIYIDVKDKDGKLVHWGIESMSPGVMLREGWNPSMLNPGDVVSVTLIAAKNGAPVGYAGNACSKQCKVVRANGETLPLFRGRGTVGQRSSRAEVCGLLSGEGKFRPRATVYSALLGG